MAYCLLSDIQDDFKNIMFTSTSLVTDTAVGQFILEAGALIDANVGSRYVTPITADVNSLNLMSLLARTLVAERIRGILANKQQTNVSGNASIQSNSGFSSKDVLKILNDIKTGLMNLSGASIANTNASFFSNNFQGNVHPRFRKNNRQW